ncbi:MAG: DUF2235 domain-containing protein [Gammaproteobacteria bacterium]
MSKRLVICCDGTGNEIDDHHSNVLKLFRVLKKAPSQVVYYDPGLGTLGAHNEWARLKQNTKKIVGLALGYGLDRNILDAYDFIVDNYESGDQLYFFGFSRGAYTVRVLAGFINAIGILRPEQKKLCPYAFTAYKQIQDAATFESIRLYEKTLRPRHPSIRFLGLFDTVSSVFVPRKDRLFIPSLRKLAFTDENPSVEIVRHALALDERRTLFRPYLWAHDKTYWGNPFESGTGVDQDTKQVWFPGVHADVGGGYAEAESGLAKITLNWMIDESPVELEFVTQTVNQVVLGVPRKGSPHVYQPPDPLAPMHDSLTALWQPLEWLPKKQGAREWLARRTYGGFFIPRAEPRSPDAGAVMHDSVHARIAGCADYRPINLPALPK